MGRRDIPCLAILLLILSSCTNPMVNYLLRQDEEEEKKADEWIDTSPVAFYNNVWYDSLREAVDAESGGTPALPSAIEIRRNISRSNAMGGNEIVLEAGKHILLKPYTSHTASVRIQRWQGGPPLFTVKPGASLTLDTGMTIDGAGGNGVYLFNGGKFTLQGSSSASSVYLEDNAKITLNGLLSANPAAVIDPELHVVGKEVLEGSVTDIQNNHRRFDVTPELPDTSGWMSPPCWRVDSDGKLLIAVAKRNKNGTFYYYKTLQEAVDDSEPVTDPVKNNIIIANIGLGASEQISISKKMRFTVTGGNVFTIKRAEDTSAYMFFIDANGSLELGAETGSALHIDGGAIWDQYPPDEGETNSGVRSNKALIYVRGTPYSPSQLTINSGAVLQNNDRQEPGAGGAVECAGIFEMNGGSITRNRTSGSGGGVYFYENISFARSIRGGSIKHNDAVLSGGGIMLDTAGGCTVTMTGGEIRSNRAQGKDAGINANCNGYGGGVFIPGPTGTANEFIMSGGIIAQNTSASGQGNGVVIDRMWSPPPRFVMTGHARIMDGVYLSRTDTSIIDCTIEIGGPLIYNPAAKITVNIYPATGVGLPVLSGDLGQYIKFTAEPGYSIRSDGKLWKD